MPLVDHVEQVTPAWLSEVLGEVVTHLDLQTEVSNWAKHARVTAILQSGETKKLWLKICLHAESGRSEVDYYIRDYADLPDAPLLRCYHAEHEPGTGYNLLFDDLSDTFQNHKEIAPTLEHGIALAEAMAKIHRHHWGRGTPKTTWNWSELRDGVANLERATGRNFSQKFEAHAAKLVERWSQSHGQTLLHGDINPTTVLTPKSGDRPVYFLDRQPLDGKTVYGLAVYDLAYAIAPWWPTKLRIQHQDEILKHWFEALNVPDYSWEQALSDWHLSVEHCLHVPFEWCKNPAEMDSMRGLWEWQLQNILGE
jgi:hypothetical protein